LTGFPPLLQERAELTCPKCLSLPSNELKISNSNSLIHHSARGIQYCSTEYQALHDLHGVICSITDGYDCYQNALAEWINGILKMEYLLIRPEDIVQARKMVKESVEIYNTRCPHLSLKYKTPDEVHQAF